MFKRIALLAGLGVLAVGLGIPAYADHNGHRHREQSTIKAGKLAAGNGDMHNARYNLRAGESNVGHLYLFSKDDTTWDIIPDGAWGKMKYNLSGPFFDFVFNGHLLMPDVSYTLIYYPDPWPGEGLICLGTGMADEEGNVHIKNAVDTGDLPSEEDDNYELGAKIWLVLTSDVDCDAQYMTAWNPMEYLFEYDLISYQVTVPDDDGDDGEG